MLDHYIPSILKALDRKKSGAFIMPGNQEGGNHMARKKTLEELQAEREKAEQDLRMRQENLKKLKQKEAELTRSQRTHRLCTHGAMLEQYISPDEFTDEQIDRILKAIFRRSETIEMLQSVKRQAEGQSETY